LLGRHFAQRKAYMGWWELVQDDAARRKRDHQVEVVTQVLLVLGTALVLSVIV
jgi:hypothetical protein